MQKIEIKKSGEIQPIDEMGYIVNTSSVDKILPPWSQSVEYLKQTYIENSVSRYIAST